jgi:hypothetical protein
MTMSNTNININYKYFHDNTSKECEDDAITPNSTSQYKELYTNTNYTNHTNCSNSANRVQQQQFVKDVTKPFTYYTVAVENETYYNPDENDCCDGRDCPHCSHYRNENTKPTFENDGCVKLYFCGLVGCCLLCMFGCSKHI